MESAQKDSLISHFSHPHLLEHTNSNTNTSSKTNIKCFGCNLRITHEDDYYMCKTCPFYLHNVCYKTPLITNHSSHPKHDLFLFVIPSSPVTKTTFNCLACKQHVIGFCYHCSECNIFFHSLCITLPLSLSITQHPHKLKLEFSPPYDFFCDLCNNNKPGYKGWLYRCSMCEFDIHIACAVKNIEAHLLRQKESDYNYKIMDLVTEKIGGGIRNESAVSGWNKKLFSPFFHSTSNGKNMIVELELQETEKITSSHSFSSEILEGITPLRDKMTPLSDERSPLSSSQQFSDSYFSIDLNKSYSTNHHDHRSQVRKEVNSDYISRNVVSSNSRQGEEESIGVVDYWLKNHSHKDKVNAAFSKGGSDFEESSQKVVVKNPKERLAKWPIKDQTARRVESERNNHSGWRKLLNCCL